MLERFLAWSWNALFWRVSGLRFFLVASFVGFCVSVDASAMFSLGDTHGAVFYVLNPAAPFLIASLGLASYILLESLLVFVFAVAVLVRSPDGYWAALVWLFAFGLCCVKLLEGLWNLYLVAHF